MLQIFAIIKGYFGHEFGKNPQHDFPKMRGEGGSTAVWNSSENSSNLEGTGFPKGGAAFAGAFKILTLSKLA